MNLTPPRLRKKHRCSYRVGYNIEALTFTNLIVRFVWRRLSEWTISFGRKILYRGNINYLIKQIYKLVFMP